MQRNCQKGLKALDSSKHYLGDKISFTLVPVTEETVEVVLIETVVVGSFSVSSFDVFSFATTVVADESSGIDVEDFVFDLDNT